MRRTASLAGSLSPARTLRNPTGGRSAGTGLTLTPRTRSNVNWTRSNAQSKKHWWTVHKWTATGRRSGSRAAASLHVSLQKQADTRKPIRCQRFFYTGRYTSYLIVLSEKRVEDNDPQCRTANQGSIAASVLRDLATIEQNQEQQGNIASEETSERDTALWLQLA